MRFGVLTLPTAAWPELVERWRYLDDLGFDAIHMADGLVHPRDPPQTWFDGWICLATAAQVTRRARIGTLVTSMIFRNPAEVVHAAIAVDHASSGRVELGIGSGDSQFDHALAEIPDWPARERSHRFRDYAARIRSFSVTASSRKSRFDPRTRSRKSSRHGGRSEWTRSSSTTRLSETHRPVAPSTPTYRNESFGT